jgi:hypothetical protein
VSVIISRAIISSDSSDDGEATLKADVDDPLETVNITVSLGLTARVSVSSLSTFTGGFVIADDNMRFTHVARQPGAPPL